VPLDLVRLRRLTWPAPATPAVLRVKLRIPVADYQDFVKELLALVEKGTLRLRWVDVGSCRISAFEWGGA
jgi:hypothetical protein